MLVSGFLYPVMMLFLMILLSKAGGVMAVASYSHTPVECTATVRNALVVREYRERLTAMLQFFDEIDFFLYSFFEYA